MSDLVKMKIKMMALFTIFAKTIKKKILWLVTVNTDGISKAAKLIFNSIRDIEKLVIQPHNHFRFHNNY